MPSSLVKNALNGTKYQGQNVQNGAQGQPMPQQQMAPEPQPTPQPAPQPMAQPAPSYGAPQAQMTSTSDEELLRIAAQLDVCIKIIGCGGGGCNTINRCVDAGIQ